MGTPRGLRAVVAIACALSNGCGAVVAPERGDDGPLRVPFDTFASIPDGEPIVDTEPFDSTAVVNDTSIPTTDTSIATTDTKTSDCGPFEGPPDVVPLDAVPSPPAAACVALADKLAELVTTDTCASIVRVSYATSEILGWQIRCDAPVCPASPAAARAELAPYVAPLTKVSEYEWIGLFAPDPWYLLRGPGDFGGVGVGSFYTGKLVFAGGMVLERSGRGDIQYPTTFRAPSEINLSCGAYPISSARRSSAAGEMRDPGDAPVNKVFNSVLPYGLARKHRTLHAWMLGYARSIAPLDPKSAEWIVVVESVK